MSKHHNRREQGKAKKNAPVSFADLHIAVATGVIPGSQVAASVERDIRLLKPALLYADHVTLYSPVAQMVNHVARMEAFTPGQRIDFFLETIPFLSLDEDPPFLTWVRENRPGRKVRGQSTVIVSGEQL